MILTHKESLEIYGSDYQIKKMIAQGLLFKIEKGIYATNEQYSELDVLAVKYDDAIFTMDSAFYFHSLTDVIPDNYFLAIRRNSTRFQDDNIKQFFMSENLFSLGKTRMLYQGTEISIYDKERMLIELFRNKSRMPYDYYKEIVRNYRKEIYRMDVAKIYTYLESFSNKERYIKMLEDEVL